MNAPATTNPLTIMFINMTIVFAVLYGLSLIIRLIKALDPTQKKNAVTTCQPALAVSEQSASIPASEEVEEETTAVIAAVIAAYGYSVTNITVTRPQVSRAWQQAARWEAVSNRRPNVVRR